MNTIVRLFISALVAFVLTKFMTGVQMESFITAAIFSVVLAVLNLFLRPALKVIGLPLTIVTFGLFSLVINAVVLYIAAYLVNGIRIDSFGWAFFFSIALSVITSLLNGIFTSKD